MKRVYKYELPLMDLATIRLPKEAQVLSVGEQRGNLFIWALVDADETETRERTFRIAGTGHNLNLDYHDRFIGTVLMHNASLVFHIFEIA